MAPSRILWRSLRPRWAEFGYFWNRTFFTWIGLPTERNPQCFLVIFLVIFFSDIFFSDIFFSDIFSRYFFLPSNIRVCTLRAESTFSGCELACHFSHASSHGCPQNLRPGKRFCFYINLRPDKHTNMHQEYVLTSLSSFSGWGASVERKHTKPSSYLIRDTSPLSHYNFPVNGWSPSVNKNFAAKCCLFLPLSYLLLFILKIGVSKKRIAVILFSWSILR